MNEKMIFPDDPEAAKEMTVTGWVSRHGRFLGRDERSARWDGCTHVHCSNCGKPVIRMYTKCNECRDKIELANFEKLSKFDWDGKSMLYSEVLDKYFATPDEAEEELEYDEHEGLTMQDLRLVICEPVYARFIDNDIWCDDLPEDTDVPDKLNEAIDVFNKSIDGILLSWEPGKKALLC